LYLLAVIPLLSNVGDCAKRYGGMYILYFIDNSGQVQILYLSPPNALDDKWGGAIPSKPTGLHAFLFEAMVIGF